MLTAIVGAAAGYWYVHTCVDEEIRARVEAILAEHYAPYSVSVDSARRVKGKGIEIRGLSIVDPSLKGRQAELVSADEVFLACRTDLTDLARNELGVSQVAIRGLVIRAMRRADGSWSCDSLLPLPKTSDSPCGLPVTTIEGATVEILDPHKNTPASLTLRQMNLAIGPQQRSAAPQAAGAEIEPGEKPAIRFHGEFSGDHFQRITVEGVVGADPATWSAQGTIQRLAVSPELRRSLPAEMGEGLAAIESVRGQATLRFQVRSPAKANGPCRFVVTGKFTGGVIDDARLPSRLTDVRANVYCDNAGIKIDNLTARSGETSVWLSLVREGFAKDSPIVVKATARRVRLDRNLADALARTWPDSLGAQWDKFLPEGVINADATLTFDGQRWKPELAVACLDVSLEHYKFPYRLTGGTGTLRLKDDVLEAKIWALAGQQPVRIEGRIVHPGPECTGWIEVWTKGSIPIDEKLIRALNPAGQKIVRRLHPRGGVTCWCRLERSDPASSEMHRHVTVKLDRCSIRYEKFPYPIEQIGGTLELTDRTWTFRDLEGRNDSGYIIGRGGWTPAEDAGGAAGDGELTLELVGTDVALEDELRDALPPGARQVWADLRLRGSVDHLAVAARYRSRDRKLSVDVRAQKWPGSQNVEGRSVSIQPVSFPLRIEQVTGAVHYRDGHIEMTNLRGRHGALSLAGSGTCDVWAGGWTVRLSPVTADRLQADRELIAALPPELRRTVARLNLTGPISVQGAVQFGSQEDAGRGIAKSWDLTFDVENGSLDCGIRLEHIHGGVRLIGGGDDRGYSSRGRLAVDSLMYKEFQFTDIRGPLRIDRSRVVFGTRAVQDGSREPATPITAKLYGGTLRGDADVALAGDHPFALQATLADADLARFSEENLSQGQHISGKAHGWLRLGGTSRGAHTLRGDGMLRLRDADIYKLPLMVSLLKILTIRPPDRTAFTTANIDFRVEGDHLYFDRIDFNGDAISLKGEGQMNLDRKIDMRFYTVVGRGGLPVPILRPLWYEASRQFLLIEVGGSLDKPKTGRKVLPALNETLQQMFPEEVKAELRRSPNPLKPRQVLERTGILPKR